MRFCLSIVWPPLITNYIIFTTFPPADIREKRIPLHPESVKMARKSFKMQIFLVDSFVHRLTTFDHPLENFYQAGFKSYRQKTFFPAISQNRRISNNQMKNSKLLICIRFFTS